METNGSEGKWYSITDALDAIGISRRTLYDRINKDELKSKKEGKNRFVWIDNNVEICNETYRDMNGKQKSNIIKALTNQVEYFKDKVEKLEIDLRETNLRHDATIFKMIEQNQMLLETAKTKPKTPFWKFW